MTEASVKIEPVPIHVASIEPGIDLAQGAAKKPMYRTKYETFVLTANDQTACILGQADDRVEYYILAVDNDIVLGPTKGVAANPSNIVAGTATISGGYLSKGILAGPFRENGQLYAGVTTTATSSRVTVIATYQE